jgi:hypothetical protein
VVKENKGLSLKLIRGLPLFTIYSLFLVSVLMFKVDEKN